MDIFDSIKMVRHQSKGKNGIVLTIGDFDGCHIGHKALLEKVIAIGKESQLEPSVLTFEPSAKVFFSRNQPNDRIFTLQDKMDYCRELGIGSFIVQPFDESFSNYSYQDFFQVLLVESLLVQHLVLGGNFRFGKDRAGDINSLKGLCDQSDIGLSIIDPLTVSGARVSSTGIRQLIAEGDVVNARERLGRPYFITGKVQHGNKIGRTIGFPTANIFSGEQILPKNGVYAAVAQVLTDSDKTYPSAVNVGRRPTIEDNGRVLIEAHLITPDSDALDIYDQDLRISFVDLIREERKFSSREALVEQIGRDIEVAKGRATRFQMDYLKSP